MEPIVTPAEMGRIDAAAPDPVEELIRRAGAAVAREAIDLLGGTYGRRVLVLAGKGNNGNDGRSAAEILVRRGVRCQVLDANDAPPQVPKCDLLIDAALGTGFKGEYRAPLPAPGTPVLAVDIPSGLDGLTGRASGRVLSATRTVTFAAHKPGLLLADGPGLSGEVNLVDIGLDTSSARAGLVTAADAKRWVPRRGRDAHKWRHAVWVIGGSPGMVGAAELTASAAARSGAGYVRLSVPDAAYQEVEAAIETVVTALPATWAYQALEELGRFRAAIVGNGIGVGERVDKEVRRFVRDATVPVVVDGDGLTALGSDAASFTRPETVLTPHDGEYSRLAGSPPSPDRFEAVRSLGGRLGCVVLLKGPTTLVGSPDGFVRAVAEGDQRLASAGTGDVLAGVAGALLALGGRPDDSAAAAAFLHGRAARLGFTHGLVAHDLIDLLPVAITELLES